MPTTLEANQAACELRNLAVQYPGVPEPISAVRNATLEIGAGEIMGVVGESGSGKTTLAMALLRMLSQTATTHGEIRVRGVDVLNATPPELQDMRRRNVSVIMQDPTASLNPVRTVGSQLVEAARMVRPTRGEQQRLVAEALDDVGLESAAVLNRYPFELSGGMNQRVAIAMAVMKRPHLLVADEPTSALDVRTQAMIMTLLAKIRDEYGTGIILITHDIGLALHMSDRVAVMYGGRIVEIGRSETLKDGGSHPYTNALIEATPKFHRQGQSLRGIPGRAVPVPVTDPGCPFRDRCPARMAVCDDAFPARTELHGSSVWCWRHEPGRLEGE